jgi:type VI secretion system ImpA family protein
MTALETTTGPAFDLGPLLAPIPGQHPAGEWLRYDAAYDELRKLREADDPSLPQGVWKRELKRADWNGLAARAAATLSTRSKDLQIAVWLTEAWLHQRGLAGFAAGMRTIAALCRDFWDTLYPPLEDGSADGRLAPLAWAADKLLFPLESLAVTSPAGEESAPLSWADRGRALYYQNLEESHPSEATAAYRAGTPTFAQFHISASLTSGEWYASLARDAAAARAAVDEVESTLAERAGAAGAPSFTAIEGTLDAIGAFAARIVAERVHGGEIEPPAGIDPEAFAAFAREAVPIPAGTIASRAEAFQRLREAADFLFRTEPHSPVPYLVTRAISWEHLPLPQLLAELLQKNELAAVYALLGMESER